ncbi:polysaccharide deacetylase family protein [Xanthobacter variabilis]|uniref:polysaccharide deacetylase family protein n=1 Tax=Xanthobacter variabilis TaxID=3119932 RepID=UPI003727F042
MIKNPVPWPNGARCAVVFTWDMDADSILHLAHPNDADTRLSTNSMLRYGPEIGVPRIMDLCRDMGVKHTFFVPGWCAEQYPDAVEAMMKGGHEVALHGYLHEYPNEMTREQEEFWTRKGADAIAKISGKYPRGYRAPWYKYSRHSTDILAELGFIWDTSLMGDDNPYLIRSAGGELVELPSRWQLDDWPQFVHNHDLDFMMPVASPQYAMDVYMAEFYAMWEYGGIWVNCFHPFCSGQVARLMMVRDMMAKMQEKGDVWFATGEEVAAHLRKLIAEGKYDPRVDHLPFYTGRLPELAEDYVIRAR